MAHTLRDIIQLKLVVSKEEEGDFMVLEWVDDVHGVGIGGNEPRVWV
jgi:hypothetical protein